MNLFPDTAPIPSSHRAEHTIYDFLCRADGAYWGRVRALLEAWFAELAPAVQSELEPRFRRGDPEQVVSAFWELYVHEGFRRSGFSLTPHPDLPDTDKHPDFLVEGRDLIFYLECVVAGDPAHLVTSERRRRQVYDTLRKLQNDQFWLKVRIEREGGSSPSGATLRRRVDAWLGTLDRTELRRRYVEAGSWAMTEERFRISDWIFTIRPLPKPDEVAGQPSRSPIGIFPSRTGYSEVRERIADALREKASSYGQLDRPYVIAVLSTGIFSADDEDVLGALFGQWTVALQETADAEVVSSTRADNGLWAASRNRQVSGVVSATRLMPWSVQTQSPRLWLNHWADWKLKLDLGWLAPTLLNHEAQPELKSAALSPNEFFDLAPDWPGPEKPFE